MKNPVIVDLGTYRTAFTKSFSKEKNEASLQGVHASTLGALLVREFIIKLKTMGVAKDVVNNRFRVLGSNVGQPYDSANIARVCAVKGGLPVFVPAETLNKNCGSGVAALHSAGMWVETGNADAVLVVGMESMSNAPLIYRKEATELFAKFTSANGWIKKSHVAFANRKKFSQIFNPLIGLELGLTDPLCDLIMGLTAENLAKDPSFGITRLDQDEFALESQLKAANAKDKFKEEIIPVTVLCRDGAHRMVDADNGIDETVTVEKLGEKRPYFDRKYGTVTPGNSSQITDGAAIALVMNEEKAQALGLSILGCMFSYTDIGFEPARMGLSPVGAIAKMLKETKHSLKDFRVVEINEAFAVQVLACLRTMNSESRMKKWFFDYGFSERLGEIDADVLNPNGGAVALGHPVGVTGIRIVISTLMELKRRGKERGLVSACVGGGQGVAAEVRREE